MNTSDGTNRSAASKSGDPQTTIEDPAQTLANIKIPRHRLEKTEVEACPPQPGHTASKGAAASVSEVNKTASPHILKIDRTIGGVKINVCIFQEPTPASPEESEPNCGK